MLTRVSGAKGEHVKVDEILRMACPMAQTRFRYRQWAKRNGQIGFANRQGLFYGTPRPIDDGGTNDGYPPN